MVAFEAGGVLKAAMSDSAKFVTWLGGKIDETLTQAAASGDLGGAWATLSAVDDALEDRISMVFGAVISSTPPWQDCGRPCFSGTPISAVT